MQKKHFLTFIPLVFMIGCSAPEKSFKDEEAVIKKLLGGPVQTIYNSDSTFALNIRQEKSSALNPNPPLKFIVYNFRSAEFVFEDSISAGSAIWISNDQIEVRLTPGIVSADDGDKLFGYIYNVKSGEKSDLNASRKINNH